MIPRTFQFFSDHPGETGPVSEGSSGIPGFSHPELRLRFETGELLVGGSAGAALMGILNVTPDSFSDGGRHATPESAVEHGRRLARDGACIIDVGGESTRPGAEPVAADVELERTIPVIETLRSILPGSVRISIDTMKAEVARAACGVGAEIINDVSGLSADPAMRATAAELGVHVIINHMRGEPRTMQSNPSYRHLIPEILAELAALAGAAVEAGTPEEKIIIDPGIGFGKRPAQNLEILRHLPSFVSAGRPVAIGVSRKSFLGALGGDEGPASPGRADATLAAETWAALGGAHIIRTHEPARAMHAVRLGRAACGNI